MGEPSGSGQDTEQPSRQMKAIIIAQARKGVFDRNPLLNTTHLHTCPHCQHRQRILYLNFLNSGDFEIGKTAQIEVLDSSGPMRLWEQERMTPLIISYRCDECGSHIEVQPVSVEYLQLIIDKPLASNAIYG